MTHGRALSMKDAIAGKNIFTALKVRTEDGREVVLDSSVDLLVDAASLDAAQTSMAVVRVVVDAEGVADAAWWREELVAMLQRFQN